MDKRSGSEGSWKVRLAVVAVAGWTLLACQSKASVTAPAAMVQRGEYLVNVLGCGECHTPLHMGPNGPEPDPDRILAGNPSSLLRPPPPSLPVGPWGWVGAATNTAFAGPWGVSYATNLTPDVNTGMGIWTEDMFVRALRTGRHMGQSRPILPPMPWPSFAHLTDEDLAAVYAYLRSVPPVSNLVPDAVPHEEAEPPHGGAR